MADPLAFLTFSLIPSGDNVHLLSPDREHDTDALACWCGPTYYRVCDECEDGCWR